MDRTARIDVFDKGGEDRGYIGTNQRWWSDPDFPHAFAIFDLNGFYSDPYFGTDHVRRETVTAYADYVLAYGQQFLDRPVASILECGAAAGWFSEEFIRRGIDLIAVEGTHAGHARLAQRIPAERAIQHDLRRRLDLQREFDVVLCTEVAEHIEPPFSSQLVENLVRHAPLVWFSFEPPGTNEAHYHHCNEQPLAFWVNLFAFYGYAALELPGEVTAAVQDRGRVVFYDSARFGERSEARQLRPALALGHGVDVPRASWWRRLARLLLPPVIYVLHDRVRRGR